MLGRVVVNLIDDVESDMHGQTTDHLRWYRIQVLLSLVGRWCRQVVSLKTNLTYFMKSNNSEMRRTGGVQ